jgi:hypothetical protein
MKTVLMLLLLSTGLVVAGERYVVTPGGDYFRIPKGQSAVSVAKAHGLIAPDMVTCTDKATFGFSPDKFPPNGGHIGFHKDVIGSWFIVPANGTIDSIFWNALEVCAQDSTLYVRIHNSNVYPGVGPGYAGFPNPSSSTCWGFYDNTNDLDNGVAAFIEEATPPGPAAWHSTVDTNFTHPSFPPMGSEIWGFGGFPAVTHANQLNYIDLADLGRPLVSAGQKIMINFRINGEHGEPCAGGGATTLTTGFRTYAEADPLKTQNWKFYEHVVTFQSGFACKGWVARGDFQISIWYTMSVTSNIPPRFLGYDQLNNTFVTTNRTVSADIEDCNPEAPGSAGVASAVLRYTLDDVSQPDVAMTNIGGTTWEGDIPGAPANSAISYRIVTADFNGMKDSTAVNNYKVVELGNEWYAVDTAAACTPENIAATGTEIPTSAFFNPHDNGSGTSPKDDGTAGPFDMGADFMLFGDNFRYAWVGVNGAIALTKSASDTNDVNANGFATSGWDFPYSPVRHGRADTVNLTGMPRMFIAPFWADHIVEQDSPAATFGKIRYGNNGDPDKFIVQWDSIGTFDANGSTGDITTFRVVLNRSNGTVEFQYKSCGANGLDSAALVGMQYDTSNAGHSSPYVFINNQTYPYETKPRDNYCVRFTPTLGANVLDGWNIVSLSGEPADGNHAKTHLFPTAVSPAYRYQSGYATSDSLQMGLGYWMRFSGTQRAGGVPMIWTPSIVVNVTDKWNMIGSASGFVLTASIVPGGGASVSSPYYSYHGGYSVVTSLPPSDGAWVKVNGNGTLSLTASAAAPKAAPTALELGLGEMNSVMLTDAAGNAQTLYFGSAGSLDRELDYYEMPPTNPSGNFDARFTSNRMVETYAPGAKGEFPIAIRSSAYPVTVSWTLNTSERAAYAIGAGSKSTRMAAVGATTITDPAVKSVVIRTTSGTVPARFALSQNYPNPFNPTTRFAIDVASGSPVDVTVFDILGRRIATILHAEKEAGSYTMEWNGRDDQGLAVPTGMYIIRMTAGEFTASQKVSLLK